MRLLEMIERDHRRRTPKHPVLVLLGDLVDRGPDSAQVVRRAKRLSDKWPDVRVIAGNHEELLLKSCRADMGAVRILARNGGRETALSYGITESAFDEATFEELAALLASAVPADDLAFIEAMSDLVVIGDYAFVHAGVRPGIPLAAQKGEDLRWIRERFLNHSGPHERFIVHGHTITENIDEQTNRLGIDTGAYATGRLSAVALEADRRWFLQT